MNRQLQIQRQLEKILTRQNMTHTEICQMYQCSSKTASAVLSALVRDKKAFAVKKTRLGVHYSAHKPVPVAQTILNAMGEKAWFAKELAESMGMERNALGRHLAILEQQKKVIRQHHKAQFWLWKALPKVEDDFVSEADEGLRDLMRQAWLGTPWQGMEAVL